MSSPRCILELVREVVTIVGPATVEGRRRRTSQRHQADGGPRDHGWLVRDGALAVADETPAANHPGEGARCDPALWDHRQARWPRRRAHAIERERPGSGGARDRLARGGSRPRRPGAVKRARGSPRRVLGRGPGRWSAGRGRRRQARQTREQDGACRHRPPLRPRPHALSRTRHQAADRSHHRRQPRAALATTTCPGRPRYRRCPPAASVARPGGESSEGGALPPPAARWTTHGHGLRRLTSARRVEAPRRRAASGPWPPATTGSRSGGAARPSAEPSSSTAADRVRDPGARRPVRPAPRCGRRRRRSASPRRGCRER